jgi:Pyridoxamine-phosphate oxidase
MDKKELFIKYMADTTNIALATCSDGAANIRIVSIGFDEKEPGVLYFLTDANSKKAAELAKNPEVVFVPVPDKPDTDISIRVWGKASTSDITIERIAELIGRHLPEVAKHIPQMAPGLALFEIRYETAQVSLGMDSPDTVTL